LTTIFNFKNCTINKGNAGLQNDNIKAGFLLRNQFNGIETFGIPDALWLVYHNPAIDWLNNFPAKRLVQLGDKQYCR
jgi:hypothetical protein